MAGPLSHLRILDLSRVLAGPWCGQTLADLGADVIKVEKPGDGDDTRGWGPPFLKDGNGQDTRESTYYLSANRGKRSVAIDFTRPEGQELVRRLVLDCDVVLENFKVGGLAKYGLDYASLKAIKPDLIYCSITGFGQSGPFAQRAGYDFLVQGMGGLMSLTGAADGEPMKVGVALTDIFTGMYASVAVLAALAHRDRTGEGQHIDLALLDVQVAVLANQASNYLVGGMIPRRLGNAHPNIVPYQAFPTSNGYAILAVGNDAQFARFCAVAGRAEIATNADYATNAARVRNRAVLVPMLQAWMQERTTEDWIAALEAAGVPCGPINTLDQVFANRQIQHRDMVVETAHPTGGTVRMVANPIKLSGTPIQYDRPAPMLGADTDDCLTRSLGLDEATLADLRAKGVIGGV